MKLSNPIIPGFYPDPSICRAGDNFYLVNSSFAYTPGIPIWHSKDLVHWEQIGYCLTRSTQMLFEQSGISGGVWAPTIRYHEGRFYMVTTNQDGGGHFYVYTDDPAGEWSDPIFVEQEGIDPSLFFDEDGTVYFTSTGYSMGSGIYQCEIDIHTGKKLSETRLIWTGTGGRYPEGPHIYKINGYYYLSIAEGGTEQAHMQTVARSESPYGPFEACPHNPILSHRSILHPIQAAGHTDLVEAPDGSWWAVFLGIRYVGYPYRHHIGRETFLAPVQWTADGWPVLGEHGVVDVEIEVNMSAQASVPYDEGADVDHFDQDALGLQWNFIRNADQVQWSLSERNGWLTLRGADVRLTERGVPAFVGCRQRHWNCEISTKLEFDPREGDEAGLAVFMDERHHYSIGLTKHDGKNVIRRCRQVGSMRDEVYSLPITGTAVTLKIEALPDKYMFVYQGEDQVWHQLGEAETHLISTEVAGGFTGVFFGLYNVSKAGTAAYFDWFKYAQ